MNLMNPATAQGKRAGGKTEHYAIAMQSTLSGPGGCRRERGGGGIRARQSPSQWIEPREFNHNKPPQ